MTIRTPIIRRIRQNHALEHATVHTLSRWHPGIQLVGRSDWSGFWLYGDAATETVQKAVAHGMTLLQAGDAESAIHPRCGTNMATGILLASAAGLLTARTSRRSRVAGFVCALASLWTTLKLAQPLGLVLQRYVTTSADLDDLDLSGIERIVQGNMVVHHVITRGLA